MKIDWKCWIPVIGVFYALKEGLILLSDEYIEYQKLCWALFLLGIFWKIIKYI